MRVLRFKMESIRSTIASKVICFAQLEIVEVSLQELAFNYWPYNLTHEGYN